MTSCEPHHRLCGTGTRSVSEARHGCLQVAGLVFSQHQRAPRALEWVMKQQLGHYDIVAELGRGGMGVVYKGYEGSLNRYVAIKGLAALLGHDASCKER